MDSTNTGVSKLIPEANGHNTTKPGETGSTGSNTEEKPDYSISSTKSTKPTEPGVLSRKKSRAPPKFFSPKTIARPPTSPSVRAGPSTPNASEVANHSSSASASATSAAVTDQGGHAAASMDNVKRRKTAGADTSVSFRENDIQSGIELSQNNKVISCLKGHRMARSTHSVPPNSGCWYFEFEILPPHPRIQEKVDDSTAGSSEAENEITRDQIGHVRIGVATNKADLNCSVGFDEHSWGLRALNGSKLHLAARIPYTDPLDVGDIVGCLLYVGSVDKNNRERTNVLSHSTIPYLVLDRDANLKDRNNCLTVDSYIRFYVNGKDRGLAFVNLTSAEEYFAAASCYIGGSVRLNGGPNFAYPPATSEKTVVSAIRQADGTYEYEEETWEQQWKPLWESI